MESTQSEKKDLSSYINRLPTREKIIKGLAEVTMSDTVSVYRWINGKTTPPPLKRKVIADYLGVSVEDLFPNLNRNEDK